PKAARPVAAAAAWAALVVAADLDARLRLPPNSFLIQVASFGVSKLLAFRTKTGGDRYNEGRKLWSEIEFNCFQLACAIKSSIKATSSTELSAKKTAINLVIAFPIATKHFLRHEHETTFTDLSPFLKNMSTLLPAATPLPPSNLPLALTIVLQTYLISNNCTQKSPTELISKLITSVTQLQRIRDTPLPAAYSIHLYQIVILFIFALPFQLAPTAEWFTIPVTAITAFTLYGLIAIAEEIEDPLGYDLHDLPVDDYATSIERRIGYLMEREESGPVLGWSEPMSLDQKLVDDVGLECQD
ncbi:Bestrophin/UPF0187, partial [Obelidium mucronatum]